MNERILDVALDELLGGKGPAPDLAERVLERARRPRRPWGALAAAAACLAVCVWVVRPEATPAAEEGWRWAAPSEVWRGVAPTRTEIFQTAAGRVGVMMGQVLRHSRDGRDPWRELELRGAAGPPLVRGEEVSFVATAPDGRKQWVTFDLALPGERARVDLGLAAGDLDEARAWDFGGAIHVLLSMRDGRLLFTRSEDGGRSWAKPRFVVEKQRSGSPPALFRTSRGLHVISVDLDSKWVHRISADGGREWSSDPSVPFDPVWSAPGFVRGAQAEGRLHVVYVTWDGGMAHLIHASSADEGRTWSPGRRVARSKSLAESYRRSFDVVAAGSTVALVYEGPDGPLALSRDGGASWKPLPAWAAGGSEEFFPSVWLNPDATLRIASMVPWGRDKTVLLARFHGPPPALDVEKELAAVIEGHSDVRRLAELGEVLLPRLRRALAEAVDPAAKARLEALLRRIRQGWPDADEPPDWWPAVRK